MNTNGLLIAFAATTCWALSVFPFTKAGRLMSVAAMNLVRLVLGTLFVFTAAFIFEKQAVLQIFSQPYLSAWIWFSISGLLALGIGDYFGLRMYAILGPRYGSVLTTLSPAAALIMGFILLGERINYIGIAGMLITITGVMSISLGPTERSKIPDHGQGSVLTGIIFGIISALCNGAGLAFSKNGFLKQQEIGMKIMPLTASFIRFFTATLVVLLFLLLFKKLAEKIKNIRIQPPNVLGLAVAGTILGPLLGVSFALIAIQSISVAVAQTIFALVPVVAILISFIVLKQKLTAYAIIGVLISILGVAILIWRDAIATFMYG